MSEMNYLIRFAFAAFVALRFLDAEVRRTISRRKTTIPN